jgi:hypothetical protein
MIGADKSNWAARMAGHLSGVGHGRHQIVPTATAHMRAAGLALILCLAAASCSPDPDVTGSANMCAVKLHPSYNPKDLGQCKDVCIKCDHGSTTTCSTSCTLKGAR